MKKNIILIGGGGHCKSCIDVIEQENRFEIAGILDVKEMIGQAVLHYPVIGSDDDVVEIMKTCKHFLVTIGHIKNPAVRIEKFERISRSGGHFPAIVSPRAYVSKHAYVGQGTIVMHGAVINAGAHIGNNCIINTGSVIEHDAVIEDYCHISTTATVNGGTVIKRGTFFGSKSVTKEYIVIKENSFIKAHSLVKDSDE